MKFKFSGFSGITNGLVGLFLNHFDLMVAFRKPMQLTKNGEEGSDFSVVNGILQKTNVEQWPTAYVNSICICICGVISSTVSKGFFFINFK